jgi:hypothetical protein
MGCGPAFTLWAPLSGSSLALSSAVAKVCRNDECATDTFSSAEEEADIEGRGIVLPFAHADATVFVLTTDGGFAVEVNWWNRERVQNGDTYRVEITSADGARVVEWTGSAHYEESYPNGAECDSVPCQSTRIEL